ncbi:NAD(P)H-binding protein [Aldersonia sp. NBC_00410]|uniref:SDR family oxidoreductase n=1 Tax=Aldersonia sp. NBC_00410 TaxID=2975954 RepID=UPI0022555AEF|nr:NAD(P)H-binding protein [Aldersonia sp. NBC_00410]MCX5046671.1 NAD(P)H-binding protein [Aldersonia sp. NBC_00410]
MKILIVGASGYNGSRVAAQLVEQGHWVRGFVRDPRRAPAGLHDVVVGDVTTGAGLPEALTDIDVAYYFVHSLDSPDQDDRDLAAARHFVSAATASALPRGVFFTTLRAPDCTTTPLYQRNRLTVEHELLAGIPGMTAVRAGMVLGDQSRGMRPYLQLIRRAPVIPMGPWRRHRMAVVDITTTTACLVYAGTNPAPVGRTVDVPASGEPTHEQLVRAIMDTLNNHKPIVRMPWSTPTLDAFLTSRFTDDSFHFSRHLASINRFDYVVDPTRAKPFAHITPLPLQAALDLAVNDGPIPYPRTR